MGTGMEDGNKEQEDSWVCFWLCYKVVEEIYYRKENIQIKSCN